MYLIREKSPYLNYGKETIHGQGEVDWGKNGENVAEVDESIGRKLLAYHPEKYREVKIPFITEVPILQPLPKQTGTGTAVVPEHKPPAIMMETAQSRATNVTQSSKSKVTDTR